MERAFAGAGVPVDLRPVAAANVEAAVRAVAPGGFVAVAGGDGSLSCAAAALVGGRGTLVPVPLGTLNHFARRLGIDTPEAAARAITEGHVMRVPVGAVNGRPFINNVSIGIYPRFVTLTSSGPLDVARDGEAERLSPPVSVIVLPDALDVMSLEPLRPPDPPVHGAPEP